MRKVIFVFILFAAIPVFVLTYLGFMPVLSPILGSTKPKDLGISYTKKELNDSLEKIDVERSQLAEDAQKEFYFSSDTHQINDSLTSQEITAWLNNRPWKHYPFTNLQVKLGDQGQAEISGNVDIKLLISYLQVVGGLKDSEVEEIKKHIPISGTPAFYLDLTGSISNNQISLNFEKAQIGKFSIPKDIVSANTPRLASFIEKNTLSSPSISFDRLEPVDGFLQVKGHLPDVEYVK